MATSQKTPTKINARSKPPSYFKSPGTLLRELGIEQPGDILIEAIAQHVGATIVYEPLEGSEARIIGLQHKAIITVNSDASIPRQRFSAAHELGHWMWDRGKMAFACADNQFNAEWSRDNPERRANQYAEDLLLPRALFRRFAEPLEMNFSSVQKLAQVFQTSLTATAIRLVELTRSPAMLICCSRERRRWYTRSWGVPRGLRVKTVPDTGTGAYRMLAAGGSETSQATLGSHWMEVREGRTAEIPDVVQENSVRITAELVLTLLCWESAVHEPCH